ncbi:MAG TPA: SBBP repeat-containing protein [Candidatus Acidoferrales bacterium]|nr:SBBP repeat-containing protein [Candidatus Acidoferrales bacterium]
MGADKSRKLRPRRLSGLLCTLLAAVPCLEARGFEPAPAGTFVGSGPDYTVELSANHAVLRGIGRISWKEPANPQPEDVLPGVVNYFLGSDPKAWRTGVPRYARIRYRGLEPGIDLVFHQGPAGELEYDLIVAPGADPGRIRLRLEGAIRQLPPYACQGKRAVPVRFLPLGNGTVGFQPGAYDRTLPLVIDPVISFSTYLGSTGVGGIFRTGDLARGVATDAQGNIYVAGSAHGSDFPVKGALQPGFGGGQSSPDNLYGDAFVSKFTASGSLVFSTFYGGSGNDQANAVAVDASGNIMITGSTTSTNLPLANAFQTTNRHSIGPGGSGFVARIAAGGNAMLYATYLGGNSFDNPTAIAVDAGGAAYIAGTTLSNNFPTTAGVLGPAGSGGGFVSKIGAGGQLVYSTYIGDNNDTISGIAVDALGNAYVAGTIHGSVPPLVNPLYRSGSGFAGELDPGATRFVFSTLLGGTTSTAAGAIALDAAGNIYVSGFTDGVSFPYTVSLEFPGAGSENAFVVKMTPAGRSVAYATMLGPFPANLNAMCVDSAGAVYLAGSIRGGLPFLNFKTSHGGSDAFVVEVDNEGTNIPMAYPVGGTGDDFAYGLSLDASGAAVIAGQTMSSDFPAVLAFQSSLRSSGNAFVTKVLPTRLSSAGFSFTYDGQAVSAPQTIQVLNTSATVSAAIPDPSSTWVVAANGGNSAQLSVNRAAADLLPDGTYNAKVRIMLSDSDTLVARGTLAIQRVVPAISAGAIVNAASFAAAPLAPGSLFTIAGSRLANTTASGAFVQALGGASVIIGGIRAPLSYASPTQINGQVPYELAPGNAALALHVDGVGDATATVSLTDVSPGIFQISPGRAVAQNQDYSINSPGTPARPGSYITVYLTGQGALDHPVATGAAAPLDPLSRVLGAPVATIGGAAAQVVFCGLTPGFVGLAQANIQVPLLPPGDYPLVLTIGKGSSPPVTISVGSQGAV